MIARSKFQGRGISAHTPGEEVQFKKRHRQTATNMLNIEKLFFLNNLRRVLTIVRAGVAKIP